MNPLTPAASSELTNAPEDNFNTAQTSKPILYITSNRYDHINKAAQVNQHRSQLTNALIEAYGLFDSMQVQQARPATIEQLRQYHHDTNYLAALAHYPKLSPSQLQRYGLVDDCAPFLNLYEHVCLTAGATLQAADALCKRTASVGINLMGGRHHARRATAAGFCYVNDVVLGILHLLSTFKKVAYFDFDIHHGDAVEEAFAATNKVLTVSIHKYGHGFYPGSGAYGFGQGTGQGKYYSLNLPLQSHLTDALFTSTATSLITGVNQHYKPDCIVIQCGVDGLAADPIANSSGASGWSLTPRAYAAVLKMARECNVPLLVLGGGGYNDAAAACAWTSVVGAIVGHDNLPEDIPYHEYWDKYSPSFSLYEPPPSRPRLKGDDNDEEKVKEACRVLIDRMRQVVEYSEGNVSGGGGDGNNSNKRMRQ